MSNLSFVSANGDVFALDGDLGVQLVGMVQGLATSPFELVIENNVAADGGVLLNRRRPPQRVVVGVLLDEEVALTRLQQWGRFQAAAYAGGKFVFDGESETREMRQVVFESSSRDMIDERSDSFSASFIALDPWWYGEAVQESFLFGEPTPWDAPIPWDSPIPWNGGAAMTATITGDADALPLWTITGAVTELIVSNGGQSWTWIQDLASSAFGTVDHRPGTRSPRLGSELNGDAESGFGLWFLLSNASTLDWGLTPGENSLVVSAAGEDGSTALSLWYEPRWLTPG